MNTYFRELKYFVRKNYLLYGLSILVISLTAITVSFTCFLIFFTASKENFIKTQYEGVTMTHVLDNLFEDYSEYTSNIENINRMGNFYNALNDNKNYDYLAATSQPLHIKDFQSESRTFYEEDMGAAPGTSSIKSIQLNKKAFDFYNLQLLEGNSFNWDSIKAEDTTIPILLGSEYQGIYHIDDVLEGNFYQKPAKFKVIGYIKENTSIYHNQNVEFYVDDYILVPYPAFCSNIVNDSTDIEFKKLSYLNMINGNIASSNLTDEEIITALKDASFQSGFDQYLILGQANFSQQLTQMITIMNENQSLFMIVLITLGFFTIVTQTFIHYEIAKRRTSIHTLYWEIGEYNIYKELSLIQWIPYLVAFIITLIFILLYFNEGVIIGIITSVFIFIFLKFICDLCAYQLLKRSS